MESSIPTISTFYFNYSIFLIVCGSSYKYGEYEWKPISICIKTLLQLNSRNPYLKVSI